MAKTKKFDFRVIQIHNSWTTEIIRRVTSKKTHISKSQDGFASEDDARQWGETEMKNFLQNLSQRNKRHSK